jgi:YD repeat-containing protein
MRLAILLSLAALTPPVAAQSYTYDADGRLTQVTYPDGTTISTTYDAAGNVVNSAVTPTPPAGGGGGGGGGGGCFIATAAYGSDLHPHVAALRDFRDEWLLTNTPGRTFVEAYYAISPPVADVIAEYGALRWAARAALAPLVYAVVYPRTAAIALLAAAGLAWLRRRRRRRAYAPSTT